MWEVKLTVAAVILVLVYVAECLWFPFGRCVCCSGNGRHSRRDGKVWRDCRWCGGSGRRRRVGRRVWDYYANHRREAKDDR